MNITLPSPPQQNEFSVEERTWRETLYRYVRPNCTTSGDAAASIPSSSTYHGVTALSAPRILTLPSSDQLRDGEQIIVQDESGDAGTHNITIARAGSDAINGSNSVDITTDYGRCVLIKRGSGNWYSA